MYSLSDMTQLARALIDADAAVVTAAKALKEAEEHARQLREETLPSAMQELGVRKLELTTKQIIAVKPVVYASISKANEEDAFKWLVLHKHEGLIKTDVLVSFGKGELKNAIALFKRMTKDKLQPEFARYVHPQTLKAFIKEQLESGKPVPLHLFGARSVHEATVKNP